MSSANDSTPPTGIQAEPPPIKSTAVQTELPAPEAAIPLPAPAKKAAISAEQLAARTRLLDALLVGLVFVLTFLVAVFAARTNMLLLHLASGRALVYRGDSSGA